MIKAPSIFMSLVFVRHDIYFFQFRFISFSCHFIRFQSCKELALVPHLCPAAADSWKATFGWSGTTLLPTGSCKSVFPTSSGNQYLGAMRSLFFFNLFGVGWIVLTLSVYSVWWPGWFSLKRGHVKTRTFGREVVQRCKNVRFLRGRV